jgi:hypothetical protein
LAPCEISLAFISLKPPNKLIIKVAQDCSVAVATDQNVAWIATACGKQSPLIRPERSLEMESYISHQMGRNARALHLSSFPWVASNDMFVSK